MSASSRSVAATSFQGSPGSAERDTTRTGDLLLAFHSADSGTLEEMSIAGGWEPLVELAGVGWAGTTVWMRTATASEADAYEVQQNVAADGTVIIMAVRGAASRGIVVVPSNDDTTCPAATPSTASGLEIRFAAANAGGNHVSWEQLPGYSGLDIQSGSWTTAAIAVRSYTSNAEQPAQAMVRSPAVGPAHALTILIPSGSGTTPTQPGFPAFTPARGETRMRYTVHDLLTGGYRGELNPFGVTLDRRIGEPGTWKGKLSLANRREARKIDEIFPADSLDLTSGPGRLVVHSWRSGVLWGVHWLHTIVTSKDERGSVWMDVQGSTLDGYLLHVAIEEDLSFVDDQIDNARQLLEHMQLTSGSNIGLSLDTQLGASGVVRPLTVKAADNTRYGRVLQDYARQAGGFEYVISPRVVDGSIVRAWEWGAPKISNPAAEHVFTEGQEGGDITTWREERSALRGGTRWGAIGGTPQQVDATTSSTAMRAALVETAHIAAGWPIIDQRPAHPSQSTDQTTLDDYAIHWAARAPGAPPVFNADVVIGKGSTLDPNGLGDWVRFVLNNPRWPIRSDGGASFNVRQRLIGWALTPAERTSGGKDRVKLITEGQVDE